MIILTTKTTNGAGIAFTTLFLISGMPKRINKLTIPTAAIAGVIFMILCGTIESNSRGSLCFNSDGATPNAKCNCLDIIMIPIAASIPCTADSGKKLAKEATFNNPKMT